MHKIIKLSSKFVLVLSTILLITSCEREKSPFENKYGSVLSSVLINEDGLFRGFSLGDSLDTIMKSEKNKPIEKDIDYLYYEYTIDSTSSYTLTYYFDERGLKEIETDIFITNDIRLMEDTYSKFKKYLGEHFGNSETQGGFEAWSVKSDKYNEVRIDLNHEAPATNSKQKRSKISFWVYTEN